MRRTLLLAMAVILAGPIETRAQRPADTLSLPTPRPLRFTTDEGTWMSVDVSPDGRTLVFDLLGDLYTLPVEGGRATRITSGQAFDAMPRFSPDGQRIAYVSDGTGSSNLWVVNADGTEARALTRSSGYWVYYVSPTWSPDGRSILVSRNNGPANSGLSARRPTPYDLYLIDVATGSAQRVTGQGGGGGAAFGGRSGADHFGPRFAGVGRIWYSTAGENAQLHTLDLRSGEVVRQTDRGGGAVRPLLSPDGSQLVYASRRAGRTALRVRDLMTGDERWLTFDAQQDQMSSWPTRDLMPGMAFSPDGRFVYASSGGKLRRIDVATGESAEVPFTAAVDQALGASTQFQYPLNDSTLTVRHIRAARLSPDGRRVAFVALDRVWVAELPASLPPGETVTVRGARRLTTFEQSEYGPAWSPDGNTIAFVTWNDSTGGAIYSVPAAGGVPERLSRMPAFYEKLAFSPDGSTLYFAMAPRRARFEHDEGGFGGGAAVGAELMRMPAGGGAAEHVMRLEYLVRPVSSAFGVPHFGPDPSRLLMYDAAEDGLYAFTLGGSRRELIARANGTVWNGSTTEPAHDIVLSPAGDRIAILGMQHVFVARLNEGAPAPSIALAQGSGGVPVRRVSEVGGEEIGWSAGGRFLHYSLGASLFLHEAEAADEAVATGNTYEPTRLDIVIEVPKDRPDGTVVLRGGRVITMRGAEVIEDGDVVVRGNHITAVGARGSVPVPAGTQVIDVSGSTLVPGFVDTHAHMGGLAWGVHRTEPWQYLVNLAYGVTTVRDPQTMNAEVFDYADRVETGDILGPRIFSTGRAFFAGDDVSSVEEARMALRRNAEFLRSETVKLYVVGDRRRSQTYIQAAAELRLSPTSEGDANMLMDLTNLMDGYAGLEHTLPSYPLYEDVVRLAAASGTTYTPVLTINYGGPHVQEYFTSRFDFAGETRLKQFWPASYMERRASGGQWRPDDRYAFPMFARDAARIAAAGGRVAVGSHGNIQGVGYHFEMWGLAMGGMPVHDVLRAATLVGAHAIGHEADLGSIEPGKLADILVLDGNPLDDIRNTTSIRLVMRNGRLYEADTLDEVWPRERPLSTTQWWRRELEP